MSRSSDSEDTCFIAMDTEDTGAAAATGHHADAQDVRLETASTSNCTKHPGKSCHRDMGELPEEVLEYILSFLSPYQEHKTAALVCKQWYRLIKGEGGGVGILKCIKRGRQKKSYTHTLKQIGTHKGNMRETVRKMMD